MERRARNVERRDDEVDLTRARVVGRGLTAGKPSPRLPLRGVREAMRRTQAEVAEAAGIDQAEVSRIERREDVRLSTLRKYAAALGAECEVVFVFPKTKHRITVV